MRTNVQPTPHFPEERKVSSSRFRNPRRSDGKLGLRALSALGVILASSTAVLAAPVSGPAPTVVGPAPITKGAVFDGRKTFGVRCPETISDGSGLPGLAITAPSPPAGWRVGTTTALRLMTTTVADDKIICAYGDGSRQPAVKTSRAVPTGFRTCEVQSDKSVTCRR
ncbi:MAG: hypothetical protein JST00_38040 [Deltaproteobacteria bacterium]|nr:hypothetical protein [Deltaproteobacteria bacterium]